MLAHHVERRRSLREIVQIVMVLFKVRVVALLLFAAVAGAFVAAGGWPGLLNLLVLIITGGLAAGGASAINQYLEHEQDAAMRRTRNRPLVTGELAASSWVLLLGATMVILPALAVLPWNQPLAFFIVAGAIIYVGIYTVWLKPRTSLNIVIGGAAGSCAVLSGSAVVGTWNEPGAIGLATLVFLWTPIHFWGLALACREDYARAGVPMLPVCTTPRRSAVWGLVHGIGAGVVSILLVLHPALGLLYLTPVVAITVFLLYQAWQLVQHPETGQAWRVFHASNVYLATVLLAGCIDTVF